MRTQLQLDAVPAVFTFNPPYKGTITPPLSWVEVSSRLRLSRHVRPLSALFGQLGGALLPKQALDSGFFFPSGSSPSSPSFNKAVRALPRLGGGFLLSAPTASPLLEESLTLGVALLQLCPLTILPYVRSMLRYTRMCDPGSYAGRSAAYYAVFGFFDVLV